MFPRGVLLNIICRHVPLHCLYLNNQYLKCYNYHNIDASIVSPIVGLFFFCVSIKLADFHGANLCGLVQYTMCNSLSFMIIFSIHFNWGWKEIAPSLFLKLPSQRFFQVRFNCSFLQHMSLLKPS